MVININSHSKFAEKNEKILRKFLINDNSVLTISKSIQCFTIEGINNKWIMQAERKHAYYRILPQNLFDVIYVKRGS